jgi:catechol 2,3-dioxygenase-like lactoylglutathione lyase family enzyme
MAGIARLTTVVLDCPDPQKLADFYARLTGWKQQDADEDWVTLGDDTGVRLAFQRAPDHQPPSWPDPARPQQFHLDLAVTPDQLAAAEAELLALGAAKPRTQPGGQWRVYTDPAGHPFCLCWDGDPSAEA